MTDALTFVKVSRALQLSEAWREALSFAHELAGLQYTPESARAITLELLDYIDMDEETLEISISRVTVDDLTQAVEDYRDSTNIVAIIPDSLLAYRLVDEDPTYIQRLRVMCAVEGYEFSEQLSYSVAFILAKDLVVVGGLLSSLSINDNSLKSKTKTQYLNIISNGEEG